MLRRLLIVPRSFTFGCRNLSISNSKAKIYPIQREIIAKVVTPYVNHAWIQKSKIREALKVICYENKSNELSGDELLSIMKHLTTIITYPKNLLPFMLILNETTERMNNNTMNETAVYNLLIELCAKFSDGALAFNLYTKMQSGNVPIDETTYIHLLKCLGKDGQLQTALQVFQSVREKHPELLSSNMYSSIILAAGRKADDQTAMEILDLMLLDGIKPDSEGIVWTSCLSALAETGSSDKALNLLLKLREISQFKPLPVSVYNATMNACVKVEKFEEVLQVLDLLVTDGLKPDLYTINTIINGAAKVGNVEVAKLLYNKLYIFNIKPNKYTFGSILNVLAKVGRGKEAVEMLNYQTKAGLPPDSESFNLVIEALCAEDNVQEAIRIFKRMIEAKVPFSTWTIKLIMTSCNRSKQSNIAIDMYNKGNKMGLSPCNTLTPLAIIAAGNLKRYKLVKELLQSLNINRVQPSYNCLESAIAAAIQCSEWHEVSHLLNLINDFNMVSHNDLLPRVLQAAAQNKEWGFVNDYLNKWAENKLGSKVFDSLLQEASKQQDPGIFSHILLSYKSSGFIIDNYLQHFNSLISLYALNTKHNNTDLKNSLQTLINLQSPGPKQTKLDVFGEPASFYPTIESYTLAIYAAYKSKDWRVATQLLRLLQKEPHLDSFPPAYFLTEACLLRAVKAGDAEAGEELERLQNFDKHKYRDNSSSQNIIQSADWYKNFTNKIKINIKI